MDMRKESVTFSGSKQAAITIAGSIKIASSTRIKAKMREMSL